MHIVENRFTNVSVQVTIQIIIKKNRLQSPLNSSPSYKKKYPRKTLQKSYSKIPLAIFSHNPTMFQWSLLLISDYYKFHIESKIFKTIKYEPNIYVHYVDGIFIITQTYNEINTLKQTLRKKSVLNITTELNINKNPLPQCTHRLQ